MKKVVIVLGPTAVGKTKIGISLAKRLNTEIISGDSVQVYKRLDIGSAKVTLEEACGIKHHLIDILEPTESLLVPIRASISVLLRAAAIFFAKAALRFGNASPIFSASSPR